LGTASRNATVEPKRRASRGSGRRAFPHNLLGFVDFETRLLKVLYDPLSERLAGIVRSVFSQKPAQQGTTAPDREADREGELVAE
jgi:hypothetical protein